MAPKSKWPELNYITCEGRIQKTFIDTDSLNFSFLRAQDY
jgi:hypothetical protein